MTITAFFLEQCAVDSVMFSSKCNGKSQRTEIGAWGVPRCGALRSCQASRVMMLIGRRSTRCHSAWMSQIAEFSSFWWQHVGRAAWLNKALGLTRTWSDVNLSMRRATTEVVGMWHISIKTKQLDSFGGSIWFLFSRHLTHPKWKQLPMAVNMKSWGFVIHRAAISMPSANCWTMTPRSLRVWGNKTILIRVSRFCGFWWDIICYDNYYSYTHILTHRYIYIYL